MNTPRRLTITGVALLAATGLSWGFGHGAMNLSPAAAGATVIVVSFVKIRLVMLEFMEIRHAPMLMRIGCEFWVIGICAGVLVLYLM